MYQRLENCPICKSSAYTNQIICEDHLVTGESFALVKCESCELLFTNPRPAEEQLGKYYQSESYISHANKANSLINFLYKLVRKYTLQKKVALINKLASEKTLWDYGCGTGDFLLKAKIEGWKVYGLEPNESAQAEVEKKLPGVLIDKASQLENPIQVITAWHVIEHVANLRETIKELSKALAPDGYLLLAVPNHRSFDASYYQEHWAAYDVPRHLYHFDKESIKSLAEKSQLHIERILPMKFDAYYVSMLSEKNKGTSNLLRALYNGIRSNLKARKTGEYSSLIYILRK